MAGNEDDFAVAAVEVLQAVYGGLDGGAVLCDKAGKGADAIVELDDGRWAAFEVKLGQRQIPAAQSSLAAFVEDIDTTRTPLPQFRAVVTADGPTMMLPDGAVTFPLKALSP